MPSQVDIEILLPRHGARRWQMLIVERLVQEGRSLAVRHVATPRPWHVLFDAALAFDRRLLARRSGALTRSVAPMPATEARPASLRIDLTGMGTPDDITTLALRFGGGPTVRSVIDSIVAGHIPDIDLMIDGRPVARARPMIDNRASIAAGVDDVLARTATLVVAIAGRILDRKELPPQPDDATSPVRPRASLFAYARALLKRAGAEFIRRRTFRFAHWHTGYRLSGAHEWQRIDDDGSRFFADPFPFARDGRRYIFVEDFAHKSGKGIISVFEIDGAGRAGPRMPALEEPTHLSYPQVFALDGEIWMIPESSAARQVVLYRAESFPHRWVRHAVLVDGAEISDATLLQRDDGFWLFGTHRDGYGSTSDTLVVYHAPALHGPWSPHVANPIIIDRSAGRPAGAFFERDGRTWLPVQDGSEEYGAGIGASELIELSLTRVRMGSPKPLWPNGAEPKERIHTYNRLPDIEVIDWKIAQPRRKPPAGSPPAVKHADQRPLSRTAPAPRTTL